MFISQKDAEARLKSSRNRLRDPNEPASVDGVLIPELVDEIAEQDSINESDEPQLDEKLLDMKELEKLIELRPRANYRGKTQAQIAIGEVAMATSQATAGHLFGTSRAQAQAYEGGLRSTSDITNKHPPNPIRKKALDETRQKLAEKAASRLSEVLEILDTPKIQAVKRATNLSKIAKDMATIMEKVTPKESRDEGGVHFHIYKPEVAVEQNYQTVTIGTRE
jgi:hypothetical protein